MPRKKQRKTSKSYREKAKELYKSLRGKGYGIAESERIIADVFNRTERTVRNWHKDDGWAEIDEKVEEKFLKKIDDLSEKFKDKDQHKLTLLSIVNCILQQAYDELTYTDIITNFYDFYYLVEAYIDILSTNDPKLNKHKEFLSNTIRKALKDSDVRVKIIPRKARQLSFAIKKITEYVLLLKEKGDVEMEKEKKFDKLEYILDILKQIEEEEVKDEREEK